MNRGQIIKVKGLAKEVVALCDAAIARMDADREAYEQRWGSDGSVRPRGPLDILNGSKESGALRRRSLDLTRALSEMRKP